jgi:hypothetical protein
VNILEIEDMVKGLPDQALQKEAQRPTGQVPQFLVVSEIQRRSDMRKRFSERQPQGTVKDQIVQQGIAAMSPPTPEMQAAMMSMPQQQAAMAGVPAPMPQPMPPGMPMQPPPMGMYDGGVVEMSNGGMTELEKAAASLYDYRRPRPAEEGFSEDAMSREELIRSALGKDYQGFMPPAFPGAGARDRFIDQASARLLELDMMGQETEDDAPLQLVSDNQTNPLPQPIYSDPYTAATLQPQVSPQDARNLAGLNATQEDASKFGLSGDASAPGVNIPGQNVEDEIVIPGIDKQPLLDAQERLRQERRSLADLRMADAEEISRRYQDLVTAVQDQKMPTIDYSPLRQKQEQFLEEQMGKLRKETSAQTLIALGAGIAKGDLAGGLSEAGKQAATSSAQRRALEAKNRAIQLGFDQAEIENQQKAAIKKEENRLRGIELSIKGFEKVGATRAAAEQFAIVSDLPLEQAIATLNQSRELQQAKLRGDLVKQEELVAREVERATTAALNLLPPGAARDTEQLLILRNQIRNSIMSAHPVLSDRVPKTTGEKKGKDDQSGEQSQIAEELARKYESLED